MSKQGSQQPRLHGHGRDSEPGYVSGAGFHPMNNLSSLAKTAIHNERKGRPVTLASRGPDGVVTIEGDADGGGL
jgi:hypothetical protein